MKLFTQFYLEMPGFGAGIPEVAPRLRRLLAIGGAFINERSPVSEKTFEAIPKDQVDAAATIFGLTALGIRQAQAIVYLLDEGLGDQALGLSRSLYETVVNHRTISTDFKSALEFSDYQAASNQKFLQSFQDDPGAKAILTALSAHPTVLNQIDADWSTYKTTYATKAPKTGNFSPPSSWSDDGFVDRAHKVHLKLRAYYQWLCGFSHSNVQAVHNLFVAKNDGFHVEPRQRADFLAFFALFCLSCIIEATFSNFQHKDPEADEIILWCIADLRPSASPVKMKPLKKGQPAPSH